MSAGTVTTFWFVVLLMVLNTKALKFGVQRCFSSFSRISDIIKGAILWKKTNFFCLRTFIQMFKVNTRLKKSPNIPQSCYLFEFSWHLRVSHSLMKLSAMSTMIIWLTHVIDTKTSENCHPLEKANFPLRGNRHFLTDFNTTILIFGFSSMKDCMIRISPSYGWFLTLYTWLKCTPAAKDASRFSICMQMKKLNSMGHAQVVS